MSARCDNLNVAVLLRLVLFPSLPAGLDRTNVADGGHDYYLRTDYARCLPLLANTTTLRCCGA